MKKKALGTVLAVALGGALTAVIGTPGADAAPKPRFGDWAIVQSTKPADVTGFGALAVTGKRTAWASGSTYAGGKDIPLLMRWNGRSWSPAKTPAGVSSDIQVYATSEQNVWLVGREPEGKQGRLFRWNGKKWLPIPFKGAVGYADVVSANNVWMASDRSLAQWNGKKWRRLPVTGTVVDIDVISASSGWAVGDRNGKPLALRWNGKSWKSTPLPGYSAPPGMSGAYATINSVLALSPNDVWAAGSLSWEVGDDEDRIPIFVHWNGKKWSKVKTPPGSKWLSNLTKDGRGGFWMRNGDYRNEFANYRAGKWTTVSEPRPGTGDLEVFAIANVTGTTSMLGVGRFHLWAAPPGADYQGVFLATK